jgi:ABC-type transport system involved in multi-copper enzyme maturation permease subunit
MSLSGRRIRAIVLKELREYRRNRTIFVGMAVFPLVFTMQPLVVVFKLPASASGSLAHEHVLLYMLGIPILAPIFVAAYGVVGERLQGTLEPALTTPIRREELLLGKALAGLAPSLALAYGVFGLFLVIVALFAQPGIAQGLVQGPDLVAQLVFTPPLAILSIWVGLAMSVRASDVRVAQQLGLLASIPTVLVAGLLALDIIHATLGLAIILGVVLLLADVLGWRVVAAMFDRERLITGTR